MSTATIAAVNAARTQGMTFFDGIFAAAAGTQAAAAPIMTNCARVIAGAANASVLLPQIDAGDATQSLVLIANETTVAILAFPFTGDKMNGVANASFSIAAGAVGVFLRVPNSMLPNDVRVGPDWRAAAIT